jgi:hypothetical protein
MSSSQVESETKNGPLKDKSISGGGGNLAEEGKEKQRASKLK